MSELGKLRPQNSDLFQVIHLSGRSETKASGSKLVCPLFSMWLHGWEGILGGIKEWYPWSWVWKCPCYIVSSTLCASLSHNGIRKPFLLWLVGVPMPHMVDYNSLSPGSYCLFPGTCSHCKFKAIMPREGNLWIPDVCWGMQNEKTRTLNLKVVSLALTLH